MRRFVAIAIALFAVCAAIWGCSTLIGLEAPPPPQDAGANDGTTGGHEGDATVDGPRAEDGPGPGKEAGTLGAACQADTECSSGYCVDSVCCESACSGTCETCNLNAATAGTCKPIPDGTDPDQECVMQSTDSGAAAADANSPADDGSSTSDGSSASDAPRAADAESSSGDASDEAGESDGGVSTVTADSGINLPDGGVTSNDKSCAGACNGQRACAYPDSTKTCGTRFCNSASEAAGFVCNGAGSCTLGLQSCIVYSCTGAACGTSCAQTSDCADTHYCEGPTHKCQPKLGNGVVCQLDNQCKSGFCTEGVCCNSDCKVPGGTCKQSAATTGECKCLMDCGDGGACMLYYQDADGDGYGNKDGTVAAGTAKVGCSNGMPPAAGFVADHSDCDDGDPNVHPGQTAYFGTKSVGLAHTFDYNCDGMLEKQTPEFPGGCQFCNASPTCGATSSTCTTASEQSAFTCGPRLICFAVPCRPGVFCPPPCRFSGCYPRTETGFAFQGTTGVDCGMTAMATTCGTCATAGQPASATQSSVQQLCR